MFNLNLNNKTATLVSDLNNSMALVVDSGLSIDGILFNVNRIIKNTDPELSIVSLISIEYKTIESARRVATMFKDLSKRSVDGSFAMRVDHSNTLITLTAKSFTSSEKLINLLGMLADEISFN